MFLSDVVLLVEIEMRAGLEMKFGTSAGCYLYGRGNWVG